MINESLVVCYSTPNYQRLTDICIGSLLSIGFKQEQIKHLCDDIHNTDTDDTIFRRKIWYKSIINKVIHLKSVLQQYGHSEYKYIMFTDCDIRYIKKNKKSWDELKVFMENTPHDIYFTDDLCYDNLNSGFYIIKLNNNIAQIIDFFDNVITHMNMDTLSEDQVVMNNLKHTINYAFIPREYIILATNIFNKNKALLHHAVCQGSITGKIAQMDDIQARVDPVMKIIPLGLNCAIVDAIQLSDMREYSYPFDFLWSPGKTSYTILHNLIQHGIESTVALMTTGFTYYKFLGRGDYISVDTVTESQINKETGLGITHFTVNDEFKDKLRRRLTRFLSDIHSKNKIILIYGDSPRHDFNYNIDNIMYGCDASEYLIKIYELLYPINQNIHMFYFCWKERVCVNDKITYVPYEMDHAWEEIQFVIRDYIIKNILSR